MVPKEIKMTVIFLFLALILAYGTYDTLGTAIGTDTPVVSVVSDSMVPTFYKGDLLLVKGEEFNSLEVGDIIVYRIKDAETEECAYWKRKQDESGIPIVHRIVQKNSTFVVTKGDDNAAPDYCPVEPDEVKGKVYFIIPKLGWIKLRSMEILSGDFSAFSLD